MALESIDSKAKSHDVFTSCKSADSKSIADRPKVDVDDSKVKSSDRRLTDDSKPKDRYNPRSFETDPWTGFNVLDFTYAGFHREDSN